MSRYREHYDPRERPTADWSCEEGPLDWAVLWLVLTAVAAFIFYN